MSAEGAPPVLVAAELQPFLEPGDLAGLAVTWLPGDEPTPAGDYVAIVPLLTRWIGGTELKQSLIAAGLPASAPGRGFSVPTGVLAGIAAAGAALVLLLVAALRFRLRRRPEPVAA